MDPFFAPITLLSLLLVGSLVMHLIVWRRADMLRQETLRMGKVHGELRDALAVANAAKEEQAGRIAWLSGVSMSRPSSPIGSALRARSMRNSPTSRCA